MYSRSMVTTERLLRLQRHLFPGGTIRSRTSFQTFRSLGSTIQSRTSFQTFRSFSAVAKSSTKTPDRFVSILENQDYLKDIPLEDIRNFCFVAHIDHGKSSLSSRVLELTGNLGPDAQKIAWKVREELGSSDKKVPKLSASAKEQIQLLDTLAVEQQRGITVKASTATMLYPHASAKGPTGCLLLNMIDTPGHVDFGREVARSLSFVQGAVLLLDASQGIQAQTWSVYEKTKALPKPPELLIALTKVDLESARPVHVALTVAEWLDWEDPDSIILTSARSRIGIREVLDAVCQQVPPPEALEDDDGIMLRAQVVDTWYDTRGVNCLVQIVSGELKEGDRISMLTKESSFAKIESFPVQEVGLVLPKPLRTGTLLRGQLGYVRFGLRDPRQAQLGTVLVYTKDVSKKMILPQALDSNLTKSVLYASVHPEEADGFEDLCNAIDRLALNDSGLEVSRTSSLGSGGDGGGPFLGPGLRVGFQGLLHVEVFRQRLTDEFGIEAVVTPPKVPYTITFLPSQKNGMEESYTKVVEDLSEWPDAGERYQVDEPIVTARIMARVEDAGAVMELINRKRGTDLQTKPIDEEKWYVLLCDEISNSLYGAVLRFKAPPIEWYFQLPQPKRIHPLCNVWGEGDSASVSAAVAALEDAYTHTHLFETIYQDVYGKDPVGGSCH
jgi:elongation factor 4